MTQITALDRAKTAYYEDTQALIKGEPETVDKAKVAAIYASLSEDEIKKFEEYRTEVDATLYDFMMSDQSPEVRASIDLFIKDNVLRFQGKPGISTTERREAIRKVDPSDALTAIALINHPVTQAVIIKKCLDTGMSWDDVHTRAETLGREAA